MELKYVGANYYGCYYKIYNDGTIYGRRKKLTPRIDEDGYLTVTLGDMKHRRRVRVHRPVAEHFIPNPNNLPEVNHIDYDRTNPSADNLEQVSHQDNISYSVQAGHYDNRHDGEKNGRAKTTWNEVLEMREAYANGEPIAQIAKRYGKPWSTVGNIVYYKTWIQ